MTHIKEVAEITNVTTYKLSVLPLWYFSYIFCCVIFYYFFIWWFFIWFSIETLLPFKIRKTGFLMPACTPFPEVLVGSRNHCSVRSVMSDSLRPMDCSTPGLPVHHQFPEFTQTYVHWVGDAIQPSHPLSSSSPPTFNLSQHQGFFKWVSSLHQVAKVLEFQLQQQSFQWILRTDFLQNGLDESLCCPRDSQESPTPQFKSIDSGILINSILQNLYQNRKKNLVIFITVSLHCQILYFWQDRTSILIRHQWKQNLLLRILRV